MIRKRQRSLVAVAVWAAGVLPSCLPHDTRPEPGSVSVTVSGDEPLLAGHGSLTTDDGWTVSFDRLLISIGSASLDGDGCSTYYEADYRRILDMQVKGPQKLGVSYALGACFFDFRMAGPNTDAVLGEGVTEADKIRMGTPGSDPYASNRGVSLYVAGQASKGGVTKRFAWEFRQRVRYAACVSASADPDAPSFELESGKAESAGLTVRGETLFFDSLDLTVATPHFDAIAGADDTGDGDGEVTLAELGAVALADIATEARYNPPEGENVSFWLSLEDFVYRGLFPQIVQYGDGYCGVDLGDSRR